MDFVCCQSCCKEANTILCHWKPYMQKPVQESFQLEWFLSVKVNIKKAESIFLEKFRYPRGHRKHGDDEILASILDVLSVNTRTCVADIISGDILQCYPQQLTTALVKLQLHTNGEYVVPISLKNCENLVYQSFLKKGK